MTYIGRAKKTFILFEFIFYFNILAEGFSALLN